MGVYFNIYQECEDYQRGKSINETVAFFKDIVRNEIKKVDTFEIYSFFADLMDYNSIKERLMIETLDCSNNEEFLEFVS